VWAAGADFGAGKRLLEPGERAGMDQVYNGRLAAYFTTKVLAGCGKTQVSYQGIALAMP
jgi:hypothetical protein